MRLALLVALALLAAPALGQGGFDSCSADMLKDIAFGVAGAAYQTEGATDKDGRSASVWDVFVKSGGKVRDGSTADVACDHYNRYKEDVALMKSLGVKNYRLSISWSRLIPSGRKGGAVNPQGAEFYSALIDELLKAGISPAVTLYHWDLPQANQDAYKGFLGREIIDDFTYFADTAFKLYGGRVKKWITFNEPWVVCGLQWGNGDFAPGVNNGDSGKWTCGHNLLLAHATAVKAYRDNYQKSQGGKIGMALWSEWSEPWTDAPGDKRAAQNKMDVDFGWTADPIHFGDYPPLVKQLYGQYIPNGGFTEGEKALLKGSYDFMGLTLYTAKYAREVPDNRDGWWVMTTDKDGKLVGEQAESVWLYNVPWAINRMVTYMDKRYGRPDIWVLENGISEKSEATRSGSSRFADPLRLKYFRGYIDEACKAKKNGVRLSHFYVWSFLDNWEWREGFSTKFGIVHVDFTDKALPRKPKESANWLSANVFKASSKN